MANDKFVVEENELNGYKFQLVLVIKKLEKVEKEFCLKDAIGCVQRSDHIKTRLCLGRLWHLQMYKQELNRTG